MADDSDKPSYLRAAFMNVYNLSLLGGALTASAVTGEYVLGALAAGAEALWLLFGPDLRPFRRAVDDSVARSARRRSRRGFRRCWTRCPSGSGAVPAPSTSCAATLAGT